MKRQSSGSTQSFSLAQQKQHVGFDQETAIKILDIFVLWVQQEDETGQVMQQILAEKKSLEVIFSLYMYPKKPSSSVSSLLSFFISLNRMLLSSDLVVQALILPVNQNLITHL